MKDNKAHINITLDNQVLRWIDMFRGQVPRSRFINKVLYSQYELQKIEFDWEQEEQLASKDIKEGKTHKFKKIEDAFGWLDN